MLTLHTYGFGGKTSASYYFLGIADNQNKFAQAGATVEMGFLMGFATAPLGSNLDLRRIKTYTNVTSTARFGTLLTGTTKDVPARLGKGAAVLPLDSIWTLYS